MQQVKKKKKLNHFSAMCKTRVKVKEVRQEESTSSKEPASSNDNEEEIFVGQVATTQEKDWTEKLV